VGTGTSEVNAEVTTDAVAVAVPLRTVESEDMVEDWGQRSACCTPCLALESGRDALPICFASAS
jgi:hypothetical protein